MEVINMRFNARQSFKNWNGSLATPKLFHIKKWEILNRLRCRSGSGPL